MAFAGTPSECEIHWRPAPLARHKPRRPIRPARDRRRQPACRRSKRRRWGVGGGRRSPGSRQSVVAAALLPWSAFAGPRVSAGGSDALDVGLSSARRCDGYAISGGRRGRHRRRVVHPSWPHALARSLHCRTSHPLAMTQVRLSDAASGVGLTSRSGEAANCRRRRASQHTPERDAGAKGKGEVHASEQRARRSAGAGDRPASP